MKKLFFIIALIMFFLSGCSFNNFETSNLMHPPKATGEMAAIQSLIEKTVGSDIIFKYPQNGEYRSAIIMHDVDGDNEDEAIAVYQLASQDTQTYIMIIDKVNDAWQVIKTISSQNTELDKVCFGDINGNGKDDIVLGWTGYTNYNKELMVILFDNDDYNALYPNEIYSDVTVNDFDSDGKAEILTLSVSKRDDTSNNGDRAAKAKLIKFNSENKTFYLLDTALMDSTVIKYNNVKFGNIDEKQKGAVIESTTGKEKTVTEIVYWDNVSKKLMAPLCNKNTLHADAFLRDSVIQSNDINNDGIIEIPKMELTQDDSDDNTIYILSWFKYNTVTFIPEYVDSIIMNDKDSYIFVVPEKWKQAQQGFYKIKLEYDINTRTVMIFEQVNAEGNAVKGRNILNIHTFSEKEYNEVSNKDKHIVLQEENNKVYTAEILVDDTELLISENDLISNFKVI